jgi:hypothetical protein
LDQVRILHKTRKPQVFFRKAIGCHLLFRLTGRKKCVTITLLIGVAMHFWALFTISISILFCSCTGERGPATPLETFKTYTKAYKQKDPASMKVLLSKDSMKLHEQEAKAQGVSVDEIVKRETLFNPDQTTVEFRNEKIDGDKATLEVKNSYGMWETVPFVKEDGEWKIDKKGYADQMLQDIEQRDKNLDDIINRGRQP